MAGACRDPHPRASAAADSAQATRCGADVGRVVERLGERMRLVSLLAPDTIVRRELADAYAPLVTAQLLAFWQAAPAGAPGRQLSNPWPARIEVRSIHPEGDACRVEGDVAYVTSADTTAVVERRPVTLRVRETDGGWRVGEYASTAARNDASAPANVVRRYYDHIRAGDYDSAYVLWERGGAASGQTLAKFRAGFARTANVRVTITHGIRVEGAAGSQYATVPVAVDAELRNGTRQHFEGTYTLRRAMVDGATPEQRRWHIYAASLTARRR